ncbi:MAG: SBBP repeat-containing protein, partial [Thermoanaerobaculia bacterium]
NNYDAGRAIAIDFVGDVYVAGLTDSTTFPTSAGAYDTSFNGGQTDGFIAKLELGLASAFQAFSANVRLKGNGFKLTATFTLGTSSDGINPVTEEVILKIGNTDYVVPPLSFTEDKKGRYKFQTKTLHIEIATLQGSTFSLKADGKSVPTGNIATVALSIGNDKGIASSP